MKQYQKMSVTLNILFEYDDEKAENLHQAMLTAASLATEGPNTHTIESGVHVLEVDKVNYILK